MWTLSAISREAWDTVISFPPFLSHPSKTDGGLSPIRDLILELLKLRVLGLDLSAKPWAEAVSQLESSLTSPFHHQTHANRWTFPRIFCHVRGSFLSRLNACSGHGVPPPASDPDHGIYTDRLGRGSGDDLCLAGPAEAVESHAVLAVAAGRWPAAPRRRSSRWSSSEDTNARYCTRKPKRRKIVSLHMPWPNGARASQHTVEGLPGQRAAPHREGRNALAGRTGRMCNRGGPPARLPCG